MVYRCRQPPSNRVWTSLASSPARCLITRYKLSYIVDDVLTVRIELFHEIAPLCEMIENPRLDMHSLSQKGSYFMEKLKANHHYIVHNVWQFVACYEATGSTVCSQHKSSGATKHIDIEYYVVIDKV